MTTEMEKPTRLVYLKAAQNTKRKENKEIQKEVRIWQKVEPGDQHKQWLNIVVQWTFPTNRGFHQIVLTDIGGATSWSMDNKKESSNRI